MLRDTIVYFGIIQYEYNNAMCQHVAGIEKMINEIGYNAVTIGVSPNVKMGTFNKINKNKYVINEPQGVLGRIKECISAREILMVINKIGVERIKTMIMADFRYVPMKIIEHFCKKNGILFAIDIMDRFVLGRSLVSIIKKIDSELRIRILYPKIKRRIYICSEYEKILGNGNHVAIIPGVSTCTCISSFKKREKKIRLVFLGRPGLNCEKERIDWVIKAVFEEKLLDKIEIIIAGFDSKEFLKKNKYIHRFLSSNIAFYGRIKHEDCMELLRSADFSLVIRENNMLAKYGFSTKISEAFSCGIPVLATDTSDNKIYIKNGKNGFVCGNSYEDVRQMLKMVGQLSREQIENMQQNIVRNNPLIFTKYIMNFKRVVIEN